MADSAHFSLFKPRFQVSHQEDKLSRSICKSCWFRVDSIHFTSFVSSAKKKGSADSIESGRSFMKIKNSKGPRTIPWGDT